MLAKVVKGSSFGGATSYVLNKKDAILLKTNMASQSSCQLAAEFEAIATQNSRVIYPVAHISLSPHPDDQISTEQMVELAETFLKRAGYNNNQWLIAAHHDTYTETGKPRPHLHLIVNRVKLNDGKVVSSWMDYKNTEKILRKIEVETGITSIKSSWEQSKGAPTTGQIRKERKEKSQNPEGLSTPSIKTTIQSAIDELITTSSTVEELLNRLEQRHIQTRVRVKPSGEIEGLSYQYNQVAFAARKLGKKYTLKGLIQEGMTVGCVTKFTYTNQQAEQDKLETTSQKSLEKLDETLTQTWSNEGFVSLVHQLNQSSTSDDNDDDEANLKKPKDIASVMPQKLAQLTALTLPETTCNRQETDQDRLETNIERSEELRVSERTFDAILVCPTGRLRQPRGCANAPEIIQTQQELPDHKISEGVEISEEEKSDTTSIDIFKDHEIEPENYNSEERVESRTSDLVRTDNDNAKQLNEADREQLERKRIKHNHKNLDWER
ncbi:relaxase/mobilization nuclease domain-containing protein [Merismopedia glauca]|uniref:MobA/VirD2-like nuclease domain-containing protein n=2 Tax=Merismopedia TaxID=53402 RepID=A0A2T1C3R3_9CYAN|nr:relaxase/mobilization nuclease domain-containing protein [Merismopedia glauca]PSB02787.1 hypothetical protein C7B64_11585 [Merismopedia glauca CCAP 1448/3]